MKHYTKEEMNQIYMARREKLVEYLEDNNTGAAVFIDNEEHRDPSVSYYTGHSSDAVVIIFTDGFTYLIPWDEILAKRISYSDKLIPYTKYKNNEFEAVKNVLNMGISHGINQKIELPTYLTYPEYLKFVDALSNYDCRCKEGGAFDYTVELRMVKDQYEIECTKEAARVGDIIIEEIEKGIKDQSIKTETDVALLIEKELRVHGCQRTGFDTLAAGPSRSFAIHAFPGYTNAAWPADGLSILDFGVVYEGYTSDTTLTVAKNLNNEQKELVALVQKASEESLKLYTKENKILDAAKKTEEIFSAAKKKMPHGLGHSIGLEIHEAPRVNLSQDPKMYFKPGMILTLEPGLYDENLGGCRLENDVLITETGNEVITHSKIIWI